MLPAKHERSTYLFTFVFSQVYCDSNIMHKNFASLG